MKNRLQFYWAITTAILLILCTLAICAGFIFTVPSDNFYSTDDIKIQAEGLHEDYIELHFTPPAETVYSCPGAKIEKHDNFIDVYFYRVWIEDDDFEPEILAEWSANGTQSIKIPHDIDSDGPVEIRLNGTKSLGQWSNAD